MQATDLLEPWTMIRMISKNPGKNPSEPQWNPALTCGNPAEPWRNPGLPHLEPRAQGPLGPCGFRGSRGFGVSNKIKRER